MKKKLIIMASAATLVITSIGGFAYAQGTNQLAPSEPEVKAIVRNINSGTKVRDNDIEVKDNSEIQVEEANKTVTNREYINSARNEYTNRHNELYCDGYGHENMMSIMRENGFNDMARYMEEGNFQAMNNWMNNMSDEDYSEMIDIMEQNRYGNMPRMMDIINENGYEYRQRPVNSIDKQDRLETHNHMMGHGHGGRMNGMTRRVR